VLTFSTISVTATWGAQMPENSGHVINTARTLVLHANSAIALRPASALRGVKRAANVANSGTPGRMMTVWLRKVNPTLR
jgi:hypothetical protein